MESNRITSALFFLVFLLITVAITFWASRRSKSAGQYLVASGSLKAWQNGLAMSGEYMSAAALLGMTGLLATTGYNAYLYSVAAVTTWPLILFLLADPIRRLGRYTLTDVVSWRLRDKPVRIVAATASIPITLLYLIAQLVAGGILIKLLFGLPYTAAVIFVGVLTLAYVLFGGMLATSWVQIIKAVMMQGCIITLTVLVLAKFGFSPFELFRTVASSGNQAMLAPSELATLGRWDMVSLAIAISCGAMGQPQILTRFFTVPDARAARKSAVYATGIVGTFHIMLIVVGFGAMALVGKDTILQAAGGGNMAVPLVAQLLGGDTFLGIVCGVAFSTVIAVIAGLTLATATTFAHDLWAKVVNADNENQKTSLAVARTGAVVVALVAIALALLFQHINIAFLIGLSQSITAAVNFPILILALFWRRLTTAGAVAGMLTGVIGSLTLIMLSPTVQVGLLGGDKVFLAEQWWYFPLSNPSLVCVPLALLVMVLVSLRKPELSAQVKYDEMQVILNSSDKTEYASTNH